MDRRFAGSQPWPNVVPLILLSGFAAYLVFRAITLRVEYWDSFLYLNNTRALLGDPTAHFQDDKPPVFPILYIPAVLLTDAGGGDWLWVLPQLTSALLALVSVGAAYRALRCALPVHAVLFALLLLVGNRVFVRYGPMVMTDVWAMGITAAVFWLWSEGSRFASFRRYALSGVAFGVACASRYQLAVIPAAIAATEIVHSVQTRRLVAHRFLGGLLAGLIGTVVFVGLHICLYAAVGRGLGLESFWVGFESASAGALRDQPDEEPWHYFQMLAIVVSPLTLGLTLVGLVVAARQRRYHDWLFLFWVLVLGGSLFRVDHNEVRYLYPVFPALAYFALSGAQSALRWLSKRRSRLRRRPRLWRIGFALVSIALVWPGIDQGWRDQDPFFQHPLTGRVADWLVQKTPDGAPLRWLGRAFARHPADVSLLPEDEFFDVFHFGPHELAYLTRRPMVEQPLFHPEPARHLFASVDSTASGAIVGARRPQANNVRELLSRPSDTPEVVALVVDSGGPGSIQERKIQRRTFSVHSREPSRSSGAALPEAD